MESDRNTQREIAALAGGLALGMIVSRMIPLFASASGSIRARAGGDPFSKLIEDHRYIQSTLHEMEQSANRSMAYRMKLFLTLKRTLGKHALAEEDVVYPLLHDEANAAEETKQLYDEHADIKIHLFELEKLLKANADWTSVVRSLRGIVDGHIHDEEQVEFPRLRRVLDETQTRKLSGMIRREEALIL